MRNIVIIGGGLSSRLLCIQLLRVGGHLPLRVTIIEKKEAHRQGDAFCTEKDYHLLNVPVSKVSVFQDQADHLLQWLNTAGYAYGSDSFIPRRLYKRYVNETLDHLLLINGDRLSIRFTSGEASDIDPETGTVTLRSGAVIKAEAVLLAIGNFRPMEPVPGDYRSSPGYHSSVWDSGLFNGLGQDKPVLIIGTGLTMVDAILILEERKHEGTITALSPHGFLPVAHCKTEPYPTFYHELEGLTSSKDLFSVVRKHLSLAKGKGLDWRPVIDSIRPHTQAIWKKLSSSEKRLFMEHLRHIWGVARHRMAPENAAVIDSLIQSGKLRIIAGRVTAIDGVAGDDFRIRFIRRGGVAPEQLSAKSIVNCTGPASNYHKLEQPLVKNLLRKQLIQTDELKLGIDCLPDGRVIGGDGCPSHFLFTIGPPMKGVLWECTAIPEIRAQAQQIAVTLVAGVPVEKVYSPELS